MYSAVKQLLNAFSPDNQVAFKEFVILQNREGHYCFGFLTGAVALQRSQGTTDSLVAVYVPTNHLYLGDILLVRREDIMQTRLTVPSRDPNRPVGRHQHPAAASSGSAARSDAVAA